MHRGSGQQVKLDLEDEIRDAGAGLFKLVDDGASEVGGFEPINDGVGEAKGFEPDTPSAAPAFIDTTYQPSP